MERLNSNKASKTLEQLDHERKIIDTPLTPEQEALLDAEIARQEARVLDKEAWARQSEKERQDNIDRLKANIEAIYHEESQIDNSEQNQQTNSNTQPQPPTENESKHQAEIQSIKQNIHEIYEAAGKLQQVVNNVRGNAQEAINVFVNTVGSVTGEFLVGKDENGRFDWDDPRDYVRFIANLPSSFLTALPSAFNNVVDVVSGTEMVKDENGNYQSENLNALQAIGRAADAGVTIVGMFFGGSRALLKSVGGKAGQQLIAEAGKMGAKEFVKRVAKNALEEAVEEFVQTAAQDLGNDGEFNAPLEQYRDSFLLGGLGSGVMSAGGEAIGNTRAKIAETKTSTNIDPSLLVEAEHFVIKDRDGNIISSSESEANTHNSEYAPQANLTDGQNPEIQISTSPNTDSVVEVGVEADDIKVNNIAAPVNLETEAAIDTAEPIVETNEALENTEVEQVLETETLPVENVQGIQDIQETATEQNLESTNNTLDGQESAITTQEVVQDQQLDKAETIENVEDLAQLTQELLDKIDLRSIAMREDPRGYQEITRIDKERNNIYAQMRIIMKRLDEVKENKKLVQKELDSPTSLTGRRKRKYTGILGPIKRAIDSKKLTRQLAVLANEEQKLTLNISELESAEKTLRTEAEKYHGSERDFLYSFKDRIEFTPEDKERLFRFDVLSELSTEDYFRLWSFLEKPFLTHVTRQGVRDHHDMWEHSVGMGEFFNGFMNVLKNGKKLAPRTEIDYGITTHILNELTDADIEAVVNRDVFSFITIDEIRERAFKKYQRQLSDAELVDYIADNLLCFAPIMSRDDLSDRRSVHFGQNKVLDTTYGAESDNEIFFVYPVDTIISQSLFHGTSNFYDTTKPYNGNDVYITPKDQSSIPIDAALVFIPKDAMVDRKTGSLYATRPKIKNGEEKLESFLDETIVERFTTYLKSLTPDSEELSNGRLLKEKLTSLGIKVSRNIDYFRRNIGYFTKYGVLKDYQVILEDLSIADKADISIRKFLFDLDGGAMKLAEDAIPSQEYWEKYFAEHPDEKPKHIVYYETRYTPTDAIEQTLREHGCTPKMNRSPSDLMGFENNIMGSGQNYSVIQQHYQAFIRKAKQLIAEYYNLAIPSIKTEE